MNAELNTIALRLVAENPGDQRISVLTSKVRDAHGQTARIAEYIEAVKWALERPAASTLPAGSVVATIGGAFFKEESSAEASAPWGATHLNEAIHDDRIDELVRAGRATILRVGSGAS